MSDRLPLRILACGVFERELDHFRATGAFAFEHELLDAGLHSRPWELNQQLQAAIDATDPSRYSGIGLLYGVCGRAAVGLVARDLPLLLPRVHDCVALFLGSGERYREQFRACPGTLYLTPGWCEKEAHPDQQRIDATRHTWSATLHPSFATWAEKYGDGNARFIVDFMQSWRQHYQRVAFINHGLGDAARYRAQAEELAAATGWRYEELTGTLDYIEGLVGGDEDDSRFLLVPPHHRIVATHDARLLTAIPDRRDAKAAPSAARPGRYLLGDADAGAAGGLGLGVDAGGTFTDAVLLDRATGEVLAKAKAPTRPQDLCSSIESAVGALESNRFAEIRLVSLSTTLATNAIVESRGAKVGLLLMPWNPRSLDQIKARPAKVIPGRLNIDGEEVDPVDAEVVRAAVREMIAGGVEAIAVSGYAGTHNPCHEQQVRGIVGEFGLPVVCGHELSGRLDFIRRAHTAVLNARLLPIVDDLLAAVEGSLGRFGIDAPIFVVRGDGSLIDVEAARQRPIDTILSGPAASAIGARYLTGRDELLAVDIGGTTTDVAIVEDGRVAVCPEGPTVGDWKTSVAAVDILTSGLGGDSQIHWLEGGLKLGFGPGRAVPLSSLAARHPEVGEELAELAARVPDERLTPELIEFFELALLRPTLQMSDRELAIVDLLHRGPASRLRLTAATGAASMRTLAVGRLEELGVIRRAALTPTDVLHVLGTFDAFDPRAARHALEVLAYLSGREADDFARWAYEGFVHEVARQVMRRELSATLGDPADDESKLLAGLLDRMLTDEPGAYGVRFEQRRPVVGIGAPAAEFLPPAGALLAAEVIVPEHAEVANAVGAITGKVTVRASVSIRPETSGGFLLLSALGRGAYDELGEAQAAAAELLAEHLRTLGRRFGTDQEQVVIEVVERIGRLADGGDQLIELRVDGRLEGDPRLEPVLPAAD